jgi:opacity protein-like surface antigen
VRVGLQGNGSTDRIGWTAGGGVDYAFTEHWIVRLEYNYFRFSSKSIFFSDRSDACPPTAGSGTCLSASGTVGFNLSEAKVAVAYKF